MNEQLIVSAIEQLRTDVNARFGDLTVNLSQRLDKVDKAQDEQDARLREAEEIIARSRGALWVIGALLGVEGLAVAKFAWTHLISK